MASRNVLFVIVAFLCLVVCVQSQYGIPPSLMNDDEALRAYSLVPPLLQQYWHSGLAHWDFSPCTLVTDKFVRLTHEKRAGCTVGAIWSHTAFHYASFRAIARIRIWAQNNQGEHGVGVWFTANRAQGSDPAETGFYGGSVNFDGLGVTIDTATRPNKIKLLQGKGIGQYSEELCTCEFVARNLAKEASFVMDLTYREKTLVLVVSADTSLYPIHCCTIQDKPITMPPEYYVAVTARSTAEPNTREIVDIHSLKVKSFDLYQTEEDLEAAKRMLAGHSRHNTISEKEKYYQTKEEGDGVVKL
eukprot:PhF_6_TR22258/c0_g1_i1/m.31458